jgi:hypothetical protein
MPTPRAASIDSAADLRSMSGNCCALCGDGCGTPTSRTNVSQGEISQAVQQVADDDLAGFRQFRLRAVMRQRTNAVTAGEQLGDELPSNVAGAPATNTCRTIDLHLRGPSANGLDQLTPYWQKF